MEPEGLIRGKYQINKKNMMTLGFAFKGVGTFDQSNIFLIFLSSLAKHVCMTNENQYLSFKKT